MKPSVSRRGLVFVIFGASGTGKSTLLHELCSRDPSISVHVKGTTRKARQYDGEEMSYLPSIEPGQYDYIYNQYGYTYGIQRQQIDAALSSGGHHFIICNDIDTIVAMKGDYGDIVRVVFLLFDAPRATLLAIQKSRRITDDEISLRLEKIKALSETFVQHQELFDGVVVNKFGAPPAKMVAQLQRIVAAEELDPANDNSRVQRGVMRISRAVNEIEKRLRSQVRQLGEVIQHDYVFILMAMIKSDPLLADTHAAIRRAAQRLHLRAERVDDIAHTDQINNKVLASIRCAEFIVADLTHERPNVYYELGYAHAHGKRVLLTAREGTLLHFDIRNHPVMQYKSAAELEEMICSSLTKMRAVRSKK